jgi:hypothetical protein
VVTFSMMENSTDEDLESRSSSRRTSSVDTPEAAPSSHRAPSVEADRVSSPASSTESSEEESSEEDEESSHESDRDVPTVSTSTARQIENPAVAPVSPGILQTDSVLTPDPLLDESALPLLEVTETVERLTAEKSLQDQQDTQVAVAAAPSTNATAASSTSDPTANKWQDWFQVTTEQLTKNVKERSTRAYDAISAMTSSGSIRKRKRNSVNKTTAQAEGETKQGTAAGIGTLHVELISAYKVASSRQSPL